MRRKQPREYDGHIPRLSDPPPPLPPRSVKGEMLTAEKVTPLDELIEQTKQLHKRLDRIEHEISKASCACAAASLEIRRQLVAMI